MHSFYYFQGGYQSQPPPDLKQPDMGIGGGPQHPGRHRTDDPAVKDLHSFSQDFKLADPGQQQQMPPPNTEQVSII